MYFVTRDEFFRFGGQKVKVTVWGRMGVMCLRPGVVDCAAQKACRCHEPLQLIWGDKMSQRDEEFHQKDASLPHGS